MVLQQETFSRHRLKGASRDVQETVLILKIQNVLVNMIQQMSNSIPYLVLFVN